MRLWLPDPGQADGGLDLVELPALSGELAVEEAPQDPLLLPVTQAWDRGRVEGRRRTGGGQGQGEGRGGAGGGEGEGRGRGGEGVYESN